MKKWQCVVCGFIYDEAVGMPWDGIPAGTQWNDVPADWVCPDCGVGKEDFEMLEIGSNLSGKAQQRIKKRGQSIFSRAFFMSTSCGAGGKVSE